MTAAWLLTSISLSAQTSDDKVVIADATDSYVFRVAGGRVMVTHHKETTYELLGNDSQRIRPYVLSHEDATVDKASCGRLKANYRNYSPDDVFYDGTKVCYFDDILTKKHNRQTASFQRTFRDARYLARVFLQEDYFIRRKTVTFTIPTSLHSVRIVGFNLPEQLETTACLTGTDSVFTYTVTGLPTWSKESCSPPENLVRPFFLVAGIFEDYNDLYDWEHRMEQVDTSLGQADSLVSKMTAGCTTDYERIASTFQWVQQNIRYVAYEKGISGFRPDSPAEVLRKRYGDCKGMSMLLKTLLKAQGFNACMVTVGTKRIPQSMSDYPSLASADHKICAVMLHGQPLFLDATCKYIQAGYVPQYLQGQRARMEDGSDCQLLTLPAMADSASVDSLNYDYQLDIHNRRLHGQAVRSLSGDMKEYFMAAYQLCPQSSKNEMLASALNADDGSNKIEDVAWADNDSQHERAVLKGMAVNDHSVITAGSKVYVGLTPRNTPYFERIDTTNRKSDYYFPLLPNVVRRTRLQVPQGYIVAHLPESVMLTTAYGRLECSFERRDQCVVQTQRIVLTQRLIPRPEIPEWNKALSHWADVCNEQVILEKK